MGGGGAGGSEPHGGGGDSGGVEEHGFAVRRPGEKDLDWLCTFNGTRAPAYLYVRLHQTGTQKTGIAETPLYTPELAQLSIDGEVSSLENVQYDYGGGHHNDSLSFDYGGERHSYYHSSFGFGFRACRPMDCRNVYELGATSPKEEGCSADRALPEVCVSVDPDGTHAPLTDSFMKCKGDES